MTYQEAIREMQSNATIAKNMGVPMDVFIADLRDAGMIIAAKIAYLKTEQKMNISNKNKAAD